MRVTGNSSILVSGNNPLSRFTFDQHGARFQTKTHSGTAAHVVQDKKAATMIIDMIDGQPKSRYQRVCVCERGREGGLTCVREKLTLD